MTEEEFEQQAEDIKKMMITFFRIRDKGERRKFKTIILSDVHQLLKV